MHLSLRFFFSGNEQKQSEAPKCNRSPVNTRTFANSQAAREKKTKMSELNKQPLNN